MIEWNDLGQRSELWLLCVPVSGGFKVSEVVATVEPWSDESGGVVVICGVDQETASGFGTAESEVESMLQSQRLTLSTCLRI